MKIASFAPKFCIFSLCFYSLTATSEVKVIQSNITQKNQLPSETPAPPKPKVEIFLTVPSLDEAWEKREDLNEQVKIINFVQSAAEVPNDFEIAWRVARLVYFSGNFGSGEKLKDKVRERMFEYGFMAADKARNLKPERVEGHYWYAVDLGAYGLARGIFSSLSNAPKGRDALLAALKIDPSYHWGGAYRILGRYYQELPSLFSFGDKKKALECFQNAVKLFPKYRPNKLDLAILLGDTDKKDEAIKMLKEVQQLPDVDGMEEELHYKRILASHLKKLED